MVILWVSLVAAQDWPQYLGPDRTGMSTETGFPIDWIKDPPKVLWKQPLGEGFGGAAIVGGKVYVLDRVDAKEDVFRCFDMKNGKELWHYSHPDTGEFSFNGSRAVPTIEGDRAYAVGAMGTVYCMDLKTQKPVWTHNFMKDFNAELPTWAYSQSPLIVRDLVIVAPQGREAGVVAYNKLTGELMWKTGRLSNDPGYSSPVLATLSGVEQIVQVTPYLSPELRESEEDEEEDENPEPYFEKGGVYGLSLIHI